MNCLVCSVLRRVGDQHGWLNSFFTAAETSVFKGAICMLTAANCSWAHVVSCAASGAFSWLCPDWQLRERRFSCSRACWDTTRLPAGSSTGVYKSEPGERVAKPGSAASKWAKTGGAAEASLVTRSWFQVPTRTLTPWMMKLYSVGL